MTTKVTKKDKLSALMIMWEVLRDINKTKPFPPNHPDLKLLIMVQEQLKPLLDLNSESIVNELDATKLLERERKAYQELEQKYNDFELLVFREVKYLTEMGNQDKRDEVVAGIKALYEKLSKR